MSDPRIWLGELKRWRGILGAKWCVALLLVPLALFGVAHFGWRAALVLAVTLAVSMAAGILPRLIAREPWKLFHDGTIVSALLLGLSLSAGTPIYMVVVGALVAAIAGKWRILGRNWLNPAALGRAAVAILEWLDPPWKKALVDISTGASPLPLAQGGAAQPQWLDLLLGFTQGPIGGTSALLLLVVGGLLLWRVALKRESALAMIFATPIFVLLMPLNAEAVGHAPWAHHPLYYMAGSATLFMAFFFATDPVTTPRTRMGGLLFGLGAALLGVTLKLGFATPGAEMWAILAMNLLAPALDRLARLGARPDLKPADSELPAIALKGLPASGAVAITLNGATLTLPARQTILEAAQARGCEIPTLCYISRERAPNACKLCLVEVEGAGKLINSCCTPVAAGMVIRTDTPEVIEARKRVMAGLLRMHGRCGDPGCEVERLAAKMGVSVAAGEHEGSEGRRVLSEYLVEEVGLCVRCNRCAAACGEREAIVLTREGATRSMHIDASRCTGCGDCLSSCPSNALEAR